MGPSTDRLYRTNLAEVESGKKERLEELRQKTIDKYKEVDEAGKGMFRLHETRNTLDALREEVCGKVYVFRLRSRRVGDENRFLSSKWLCDGMGKEGSEWKGAQVVV